MQTAFDAISTIAAMGLARETMADYFFIGVFLVLFPTMTMVLSGWLGGGRHLIWSRRGATLTVAGMVGWIAIYLAFVEPYARNKFQMVADTCAVAMAGIEQGEVRVLRADVVDILARQCGEKAFVAASNAPTARFRIAENLAASD